MGARRARARVSRRGTAPVARNHVAEAAAKIDDEAYRKLFLEAVPENAALLARG